MQKAGAARVARHTWLLMAGLLSVIPVFANDHKPIKPAPKADPELLEFLGSWRGGDGNGIDPLMFAHVDPVKLTKAKHQKADKPVPPSKDQPPNQMSYSELQP